MKRRVITVLGATGSIGQQAAEVLRLFSNEFDVLGLAAGKNTAVLLDQVRMFKPTYVSIDPDQRTPEFIEELRRIHPKCEVLVNPEGLLQMAGDPLNDIVLVATSGTAAIQPTMAAIQQGVSIALANKEVLVAAGSLIMNEAKKMGVSVLPVDSEHAAIHQCLGNLHFDTVERLTLTASGGPFWNWTYDQMQGITQQDALKHPNWVMGQKITVDSSTMMNKGLEVIEAHHLFECDYDDIDVVVHPQSVLHGYVQFYDGNVVGHMGPPDMRLPIQYALMYPYKFGNTWKRMQLWDIQNLSFFPPDHQRFPLLKLAYDVGRKGGGYPVIMNAANEAAVDLFLSGKIGYWDIYRIVSDEIQGYSGCRVDTIKEVVALDQMVKDKVLLYEKC